MTENLNSDVSSEAVIVKLEGTRLDREIEFRKALEEAAEEATDADLALVETARESGHGCRRLTITRPAAAILVLRFNPHNRNLSIAKVDGYVADMKNGEWKFTHQGIAFTSEGDIGDGQHRLAACALSDVDLDVMVMSDFEMSAIDAVDLVTRRTTGQALTLQGMSNSDDKAAVCKMLLDYEELTRSGHKPRLSLIQQAKATQDREQLLEDAVAIGKASVKNIGEPYLKWKEAACCAAILLNHGVRPDHVKAFTAAIQQGVAAMDDSPILHASKALGKARRAERSKDRLKPIPKLVLLIKAFNAWGRGERVSKLSTDVRKDGYPIPEPLPEVAAAE